MDLIKQIEKTFVDSLTRTTLQGLADLRLEIEASNRRGFPGAKWRERAFLNEVENRIRAGRAQIVNGVLCSGPNTQDWEK